MTKLIALALVAPFTLAACLDAEAELDTADQAIINGSPVDAENSGIPLLGGRCSSVLLSNTWLLTAAHCVDSFVDYRFSADGQATVYFPEGTGVSRAIAIDGYGQPIVGGIVDDRFALAKFRTNGAIDPYFNYGQPKVIDFASSTREELADIAVDSSGRIVAVGTAIVNGRSQIAIARYLSNGQLDTSFDGDGKVLTDLGGEFTRGHAVAIDASNRILVGARWGIDNDTRIAVLRYRTDGSLDPTWSNDGIVTTEISLSAGDFLEEIAIDPWGRVLAAGTSNGKLGLVRYTTYGVQDTSYSGDGEVWQSYGTSNTSIYGLAVDASGRAIVVGRSSASSGLLVGRITVAGAMDTTFSGDGWMVYLPRWGVANANAGSVVVDSKGRIVVAGNAYARNGASAALVLRLDASGTPDLAFGGDGSIDVYANGDDGMLYEAWASDVALDRDGNIFISHTAGFVTSSRSVAYQLGAMHFIAEHLAVPGWPALTVEMGSQKVGSASVYTHPSLDVALVKLATPMKMYGSATGYEFHGFDTKEPSTFVGTTMQCYGYGLNTYDDGFGTLRGASLDVESATWSEYRLVPNEYGQVTFSGDSGGPCYSTTNGQWRVSGITSWGSSTPSTKTVNHANNVAAVRFAAWVQSTRATY